MEHILFPTGLSDISKSTLDYLYAFAQTYQSEITVINAYQPTTSPRRPLLDRGTWSEQIIEQLKELVNYHKPSSFKKLRFRALQGNPVTKLVKASKSNWYDLILMSRSPKYDWLTHWLGSKTLKIAQQALCPVLIIPPKATFQPIQHVLVFEPPKHAEFDLDATLKTLGLHSLQQARCVDLQEILEYPISDQQSSSSGRSNPPSPVSLNGFQKNLNRFVGAEKIDLLIFLRPKDQAGGVTLPRSYFRRIVLESLHPILVLPI